jgi:hypothetical protein
MTVSAPILMAAAANPLDMDLTMGLIALGTLFIEMMKGMATYTTAIPPRSQEEISTAEDPSGSIQAFSSVIAVAVLSTTLLNRLTTTIPVNVVPAVQNAGLPAESIPALISGLDGLNTLDSTVVPSLTLQTMEITSQAYSMATAQAYRTVFLGFPCFFAQNDASRIDFFAAHIHKTSEE